MNGRLTDGGKLIIAEQVIPRTTHDASVRTMTSHDEPPQTSAAEASAAEASATEVSETAAVTPSSEGKPATKARARRAPKPPSMINVRNLSVKCGHCDQYQVLMTFAPIDEDWNLYTYECDWAPCNDDPSRSRTLLEVPSDLDEFARRDPKWRGGKKHAGAHDEAAHDEAPDAEAPDAEAGTE